MFGEAERKAFDFMTGDVSLDREVRLGHMIDRTEASLASDDITATERAGLVTDHAKFQQEAAILATRNVREGMAL